MSGQRFRVVDPTPDQCDEFIRAHYLLIAEHATHLSRSRWNYVQLSLFGTAVFYSWLFGAGSKLNNSGILTSLLLLPVALAAFGLLQARATDASVYQRNGLLLAIEHRYRIEGWAHQVKIMKDNNIRFTDNLVMGYWVVSLIYTYILACLIRFNFIQIPG